MSVVVDASLVVALVVADARQEAVRSRVAGWLESGEELHAPAVLPYEVANVLARLVFDGTLAIREVRDVWADLEELRLILHPFEMGADGPEVAALCTQLRRRHATDAGYVCLAVRLRSVMWTLDGGLARNAQSAGLPVELVA